MRVFIPFLRNFVELRIADSIVIFLRKSDNRQNILLSTDPTVKEKKFGKEKEIKNVKLYKHPNPNSKKQRMSLHVHTLTIRILLRTKFTIIGCLTKTTNGK